ncbi:hypothetical protein C8R45DRAFT_948437 [Mycena sanguinolenta]|nr:hypothetical protein C8R45DRAFT_948437 [Mycena sanguinolenta]
MPRESTEVGEYPHSRCRYESLEVQASQPPQIQLVQQCKIGGISSGCLAAKLKPAPRRTRAPRTGVINGMGSIHQYSLMRFSREDRQNKTNGDATAIWTTIVGIQTKVAGFGIVVMLEREQDCEWCAENVNEDEKRRARLVFEANFCYVYKPRHADAARAEPLTRRRAEGAERAKEAGEPTVAKKYTRDETAPGIRTAEGHRLWERAWDGSGATRSRKSTRHVSQTEERGWKESGVGKCLDLMRARECADAWVPDMLGCYLTATQATTQKLEGSGAADADGEHMVAGSSDLRSGNEQCCREATRLGGVKLVDDDVAAIKAATGVLAKRQCGGRRDGGGVADQASPSWLG